PRRIDRFAVAARALRQRQLGIVRPVLRRDPVAGAAHRRAGRGPRRRSIDGRRRVGGEPLAAAVAVDVAAARRRVVPLRLGPVGWHCWQRPFAWFCGGKPWHAPQAPVAASPQRGAVCFAPGSPSVAPWQYTSAQVRALASHAGAPARLPSLLVAAASAPNVTS